MIHEDVFGFFHVFVAPLTFFASLELIFLLVHIRATLSREIFPTMHTAWVGALLTMLMITVSQMFVHVFGISSLEHLFETLSVIIFVLTMFVVRQRIISIQAIREATVKLETSLEQRTAELKTAKLKIEDYAQNLQKLVEERTAELKNTIDDLTTTKSALLNLMEDYEETNIELRKALDELRELDRMKDELISNVSHELRTPITIVKSSVELLIDEAKNEEHKKIFLMALNNLNRLDFLIGELLFFTKAERVIPPTEVEEIDVPKVVNSVLSDMQYYAKDKKLKLMVEFPDNLPIIEGNREKITQIFVNLIGNAIKFNKEDGSVTVSASYKKGDGVVQFAVTDTGIGIPADKIDRVFQKFHQIDGSITRKYGGVGLGLSIAKSLVELHGGRIWVESRAGEGATFYFTLPLKLKRSYVVKLGT